MGVAPGGEFTAAEASIKDGTLECNMQLVTNDMTGIEHFPALTRLDCSCNQLTSLDVSHNTALEWLDCAENKLTSLDVSNNTALVTLYCSNNQLTSLSSIVANEGLGEGDYVDVRDNFIGCIDLEAAMIDIQILTERLGKGVFPGFSGFFYSPQKECETVVSDWSLH